MITGMNELIDTNADIFIKAYRNVSYEILPTKEMLDVISTKDYGKRPHTVICMPSGNCWSPTTHPSGFTL
jgi:hypothetical protein